ncbi:hypothetical protein FQN57_007383 [Myotisia sp. PD_48]|nr:hypothetical protein FQN57_007383 [Myotisia sp. PD_48]
MTLFTTKPRSNTTTGVSRPCLDHNLISLESALGLPEQPVLDDVDDEGVPGIPTRPIARLKRNKTVVSRPHITEPADYGCALLTEQEPWDHRRPFNYSNKQETEFSNTPNKPLLNRTHGAPTGFRSYDNISAGSSDRSAQETESSGVSADTINTLQRKPSKWKKLGGMFRAKATEPPPSLVVYQVQVNDQPLRGTGPQQLYPDFCFPRYYQDTQTSSQSSDSGHKSSKFPLFSEPRNDVNSPFKQNKKQPGKLSKTKDTQDDKKQFDRSDQPSETRHVGQSTQTSSNLTPSVDVNIPDIELERYSVMFGSFMGNNRSNHLLARRKKALEKLKAQDKTSSGIVKIAAKPRRATSPGPAKPPTSALLYDNSAKSPIPLVHSGSAKPPTCAVTHDNSYNLDPSPLRSPLQKSHTLPLSPRTAYFEYLASRRKNESQTQATCSTVEVSSTKHNRLESEVSLLSSITSEEDLSDPNRQTIHLQLQCIGLPTGDEPDWEMVTPTTTKSGTETPRPRNKLQKPHPLLDTSSNNTSSSTVGKSEEPLTPPDLGIPETAKDLKGLSTVPSIQFGSSDVAEPDSSHGDTESLLTVDDNPRSERESFLSVDSFADTLHTAEISIARSICLNHQCSKQVLVPIGPKSRFLQPDERLVQNNVGIPTQQAMQKGHRYEKSRNALIEHS